MHADSHEHIYGNRNIHARIYRNCHIYRDGYPHGYPHAHADSYRNAHIYDHAHIYRNRHKRGKSRCGGSTYGDCANGNAHGSRGNHGRRYIRKPCHRERSERRRRKRRVLRMAAAFDKQTYDLVAAR